MSIRYYMYFFSPRHIPTDVSSTNPEAQSKQVMMASSWDDGTHSIQLDGQAEDRRIVRYRCTQNIEITLLDSCVYDLICITMYMYMYLLMQTFLLHNYALVMLQS